MSKDEHEADANQSARVSGGPTSTSRNVDHGPAQAPRGAGSGIVRGQGGSPLIQIPIPIIAPGASGGSISHVDSGGRVLTNVNVFLVFWGAVWAQNPTPSVGEITNCVTNIFSGPYMSALAQYRNIGNGTLYGSTQVTTSDPPGIFSNDDAGNLLKNLIAAQLVPGPDEVDQLLYVVIMPTGVSSDQQGVIGIHYSFDENILCAWVMNDGTLDSVTTIFSHELVEACTNPKGDGFQFNAPGHCVANPFNWCEIGDICEGNTDVVNGVVVQAYWSESDNACVVPGGTKTR